MSCRCVCATVRDEQYRCYYNILITTGWVRVSFVCESRFYVCCRPSDTREHDADDEILRCITTVVFAAVHAWRIVTRVTSLCYKRVDGKTRRKNDIQIQFCDGFRGKRSPSGKLRSKRAWWCLHYCLRVVYNHKSNINIYAQTVCAVNARNLDVCTHMDSIDISCLFIFTSHKTVSYT